MAEELVNTLVATKPEEPPIIGEPGPETVDVAPDATALQEEIERLKKVREEEEKKAKEAKEKADHWRAEKIKARGDFFRRDREEKPPSPAEDLGIGPAPVPPNKADFADFDAYEKAKDEYYDKKVAYEVNKTRVEADKKQAEKQFQDTLNDTTNRIISLGVAKYADFDEVAQSPTLPITPVMIEAMAELENPHEIAYHLGKNPVEALKIARMTPIKAAMEIRRIDMEIKGKEANGTVVTKPKITNAPPPINPLGSSGGTVEKDPNKMTQREYEVWAESRKMRRF